MTPEHIGAQAAQHLLQQIYAGDVCDWAAQSIAILGAALGVKDASRTQCGPLTDHALQLIRCLKDFFGLAFIFRKGQIGGWGGRNGVNLVYNKDPTSVSRQMYRKVEVFPDILYTQ